MRDAGNWYGVAWLEAPLLPTALPLRVGSDAGEWRRLDAVKEGCQSRSRNHAITQSCNHAISGAPTARSCWYVCMSAVRPTVTPATLRASALGSDVAASQLDAGRA